MPDIGTYGSSVYAQTPFKIMPEPGDDITWDWMHAVGLFSQRFLRIATQIATVNNGEYVIFNYASLNSDYHPPAIRAYFYAKVRAEWLEMRIWDYTSYIQFTEIGLGSAKLSNNLVAGSGSNVFYMVAYL